MLFVSVTLNHIAGIEEKERIRVRTTDTEQIFWASKNELREINTENETNKNRTQLTAGRTKKEKKENGNEQNK